MRALVPSALSALVFASLAPVALLACDQDYASSTSGRETFMGDSKEVAPSSVPAAPSPPPMAPPQMGPLPAPLPQAMSGDASTGAAADAGVARAAASSPLAHPMPAGH
jgi:hypothetical protein